MATRKKEAGSRFSKMFQPVIDAIKDLGGSARPSEVKVWILKNRSLPHEYVNAVHQGGESMFGNDVDWARFYLVRAGFLDSSTRGVWTLTESGKTATVDTTKASSIIRAIDKKNDDAAAVVDRKTDVVESYLEMVLGRLRALPAAGFERLCQRLLRESGFEEVNVTGRSGDGGLDGQGILKLNAFVSFRVLF